MRNLRILVSILILLAIICILTVGILALYMDPNKLKPIIVQTVKRQTGYQLNIEDKLKWSFYPRLAIKITHATLSVPHQSPSIDLHDIRIITHLSQLWHGKGKSRGQILIASLKVRNFHLEHIVTDFYWQENALLLKDLHASLYTGKVAGDIYVENLAAFPSWRATVEFNHVQLDSFLQDINPDNKLDVTGLGNITLQVTSKGKDQTQMISHLNGTGEFSLTKGTVKAIDLNNLIQIAVAYLNQQPLPPVTNNNETVFDSLTGAVSITEGIAHSDNLLLISPAFIVKGMGTIALLSQIIHFQLQIFPQQSLSLSSPTLPLGVPIQISGSLSHPEVQLDHEEIKKILAKQEFDKIKVKAQKILRHLKGQTKNYLNNLLNH